MTELKTFTLFPSFTVYHTGERLGREATVFEYHLGPGYENTELKTIRSVRNKLHSDGEFLVNYFITPTWTISCYSNYDCTCYYLLNPLVPKDYTDRKIVWPKQQLLLQLDGCARLVWSRGDCLVVEYEYDKHRKLLQLHWLGKGKGTLRDEKKFGVLGITKHDRYDIEVFYHVDKHLNVICCWIGETYDMDDFIQKTAAKKVIKEEPEICKKTPDFIVTLNQMIILSDRTIRIYDSRTEGRTRYLTLVQKIELGECKKHYHELKFISNSLFFLNHYEKRVLFYKIDESWGQLQELNFEFKFGEFDIEVIPSSKEVLVAFANLIPYSELLPLDLRVEVVKFCS